MESKYNHNDGQLALATEYIKWHFATEASDVPNMYKRHCGRCCWLSHNISMREQKNAQNDKAIELTFEVLMKLLFCKHNNFRSPLVQDKWE